MTIWFSLTGVAPRDRNGITRTIVELATRLQHAPADVRFFRMDNHHLRVMSGVAADDFLRTGTHVPDAVALWAGRMARAAVTPIPKRFDAHHEKYDAWRGSMVAAAQQRDRSNRLEDAVGPNDTVLLFSADWSSTEYQLIGHLRHVQPHARIISACYDLIPVNVPQFTFRHDPVMFERYFANMANLSDVVLAISQSTADDFRRFCMDRLHDVPHIEVIRLGSDAVDRGSEVGATLPAGALPFVLCVGTIEARKNHWVLYRALRLLAERHSTLPFVVKIVGTPGWGASRVARFLAEDPHLADSVEVIRKVGDAELHQLYDECLFTLFPSFAEGWGLPIAESLSAGRPAIVSDIAVHREVGGDACIYVPPLDANGWADAIYDLATSDIRLRELRGAAARFVTTTWDETAESVLRVVRENRASAHNER